MISYLKYNYRIAISIILIVAFFYLAVDSDWVFLMGCWLIIQTEINHHMNWKFATPGILANKRARLWYLISAVLVAATAIMLTISITLHSDNLLNYTVYPLFFSYLIVSYIAIFKIKNREQTS